jgi:hypothetical protein
MNEEEKKKSVDESWKKQAEKEKERLESQGHEEAGPMEGPPSFQTLVSSLGMQAMMHLGLVEDPMTRQAHIDPYHAQYVIDLLGVLEEKTKGNLTAEEDEMLKGTLGELRMVFVKVMQAVREHQAKQGQGPKPPGPDAPSSGPKIITP